MKKIHDKKFIFNNATFSNFARIEKIELIFHISKNIYTTKEVVGEFHKGIKNHTDSELARKLQTIIDYVNENKIQTKTLNKTENIFLVDAIIKERRLGIGEISAMVLAKELDGIFITDDESAAKRAAKAGIKILKAGEFGIDIVPKNKFKATLIFLEILKKQKNISQKEFDEIRELLKNENFIF